MRKIVVGVVAVAAALLGTAAPASADVPSTGLTFWSGGFTGTTVTYANPGPECVELPFVVHSEFNGTSHPINVYKGKGCTGAALFFPVNDIHGFTGFDGVSFRTAG
jgi:hypothetical protein